MGYSFQRYENYKKIDDLAFDELPAEWTLKKVKHLFIIGRGRVISQEELDDNGVFPVYSSQTHNNGCLGFINTYDFDCKQITWTTDGANAGTVFLREGKHNCTNVCGTLQPISKNLNFSFYLYSLQYVTQFHKRPDTNGAKIMNGEMAAISLCIPSDYEQQKIANLLDHETAKIDTLIDKQEKLIELLKEKRQAVISHAVTKGLNPDAPMKDSGVEWLGKVPAHWVVTRFKFLCDNIIAGPFGSSITKDMYVESGFKVYGQEQVIPNNFSIGDYFISAEDYLSLARYKVNTGDILISCVGTFGKVAVFPPTAQAGIINPRLIKAKIHKDNSTYFIREYLKSITVAKQFDQFSRGGTMGVINIAILNEILSTKPPYLEQCEIYDFIKAQKSKFSLLLDRCEKQIFLLKERKTALISAAVTGKIDLRDWVQN